jgi:mono/diheme cytochrome c family protein
MRWPVPFAVVLVVAMLLVGRASQATHPAPGGNPCANARPVPAALRLPATVPPGEPVAIEQTMLGYLSTYGYRDLGWCVDKGVRDTGPYLNRTMYGTHPAVRIYYSPEMMAWLRAGRHGVPADGAVIIKEQYGTALPAAAYAGKGDADLRPTDWTIMIRRSSASHDGWYWSEVYAGMFGTPASPAPVAITQYPNSGFGLYCLRCHASAQKAMTFSSLENVRGFAGEPVAYRVDDSWRWSTPAPTAAPSGEAKPVEHEKNLALRAVHADVPASEIPLAVQTFPPEPLDNYVSHTHRAPAFVTSSQCMGCHSASSGVPFGPAMWITPAPRVAATKNGLNVSEYGEWRWSPMGLAGRDPVFFAQLGSELAYLKTVNGTTPHTSAQLQQQTIDICMTCHGVMGKRSYATDHPGAPFSPNFVFEAQPSHPTFAYGGLARDGISCTVCHHAAESKTPYGQQPLAHFLDTKINGNFDLGPSDKLYGPFKNDVIAVHPMKEGLGIKPVFSAYTSSSRMCGSCHTINLPVDDVPPIAVTAKQHSVEQATYVEWLNSRYQTEYGPDKRTERSCQDCHMPAGVNDAERGIALSHIASRIALVQDDTYPQTAHAAAPGDLNVRYRERGYRRHELLGLNAFLLTAFKQFPEVMGVRTADYMSGSSTDLADAVGHVVRQAQHSTATVAVRTHAEGRTLVADVEVTNLTGHRFPSGVGFRRAFVDLAARMGTAQPFFESGRTDKKGVILGSDGKPLPSESFARGADGRQQYQDHFDEAHPVTSPDQVQIFEELTRDHDGNFTTSFIRRDHEVKDDRLLPIGWTATGPGHVLPEYFLEATYPKGRAAADPRYRDGRGHAIVRYRIPVPEGVDPASVHVDATLWYQSWAPYFIAERKAGTDAAAKRFGALTDNLHLDGALSNWKLRIASAPGGAP